MLERNELSAVAATSAVVLAGCAAYRAKRSGVDRLVYAAGTAAVVSAGTSAALFFTSPPAKGNGGGVPPLSPKVQALIAACDQALAENRRDDRRNSWPHREALVVHLLGEYARTGRFPDDSRLKAYHQITRGCTEVHSEFISKTAEMLYGKNQLQGQERKQLFALLYDRTALNTFFRPDIEPADIAATQRNFLAAELFRSHGKALAQADASEFIPLCCWGLSKNVTPDMFVVLQKRGMPPNEINALLERGLRLDHRQEGQLLRKVLAPLWESVLDEKNEGLPDSLHPQFQEMLISSGAQLNRILFGSRRTYGRLNNPDNIDNTKELERVNYVLDNAEKNSPLWILKCVEKSRDGCGHDLFANLQQARTDLAKAPASGGSGSAS